MTPGPTRQFDRDQVLEKAMQLFWAQGFRGTGMALLVEHLGIGRQSLYNEFGDKRGLFLAALRLHADQRSAREVALLEAPGSPLANLHGLCRSWLRLVEEGGRAGCMLTNTAAELGDADPEVEEIVQGALRRGEAAIRGTLQRALDAGELASDADPRELARLFVSVGQGVSVLARLSGSGEVASSALRSLLGLLPSPPPVHDPSTSPEVRRASSAESSS